MTRLAMFILRETVSAIVLIAAGGAFLMLGCAVLCP